MKDYANMFFCYIIVLRIKLRRMYHLSYISFQKLYMIECKFVSITLPKFELLFAVLIILLLMVQAFHKIIWSTKL